MCVCVCGRGVTAALSSGCAQTVCVFDVDLTQLLQSQTQSVHPDVDRCAVYNLPSSTAHTHTVTNTGGITTHILPAPPLETMLVLHSTNSTIVPKNPPQPQWRAAMLLRDHCPLLPDVN